MNISTRFRLLVLLLALPLMVFAEQAVQHKLVFRSGRVVTGEIVLRNEDVVIIKDGYGTRFQFPMSDIVEITELKEEEPDQKPKEDPQSRSVTNVKRTSFWAAK